MHTTIHEVARAAGVSPTTVSRALNNTGRVSAATRRKVVRMAVDLGYPQAKKIAPPTRTLGVIVPDLHNPFIPDILRGIRQATDAAGLLLLMCDVGGNEKRAWSNLTGLRRKQVYGVVIVASAIDGEKLQAAMHGVPVICFDRDFGLAAASTIRADQAGGARSATEHLWSLGHRRIVHLTGPADEPVATARLAGFTQALASHGVVSPELAVQSDWTEDAGYRTVLNLLDQGTEFTAILAASDSCAIGAMSALDERRVRVPDQVSVVGFDDIHLANYTHPRLTTVRQDGVRLGAAAAATIIRQVEVGRIQRPTHEVVPTELIVRGSTTRAPAAIDEAPDEGAQG